MNYFIRNQVTIFVFIATVEVLLVSINDRQKNGVKTNFSISSISDTWLGTCTFIFVKSVMEWIMDHVMQFSSWQQHTRKSQR